MKKFVSGVWCVVVAAFAVYSVVSSREKVNLSQRIGPPLGAKSAGENFKFAVFGDSHSCRVSLRDALHKAKRTCAFAVHLGDFVEFDDDFEYRYFRRRIAKLTDDFTVFLVRGNHETMAPAGGFSKNYLRYVPNPGYSFRYAGCLFLILDDSSGELDKRQLLQCRQILARFRNTSPHNPIFVFSHIAPQYLWRSQTAALCDWARKYQISLFFAGDTHGYSESRLGPAKVIITGCAGGSVRCPSSEVHFVEVSVTAGHITTQKIAVARDSMLVVFAAYIFSVVVPRYRWYFFAGAIILLIWEYLHFRRRPPCLEKMERGESITIAGIEEAVELISGNPNVYRVLSILNPGSATRFMEVAEVLYLEFHDITPDDYLLRCNSSTKYQMITKRQCRQALDFLSRGGRILVHCTAGKSRSTAIVLGYLLKKFPPNQAVEMLYTMRPCARPNHYIVKMMCKLLGQKEHYLTILSALSNASTHRLPGTHS